VRRELPWGRAANLEALLGGRVVEGEVAGVQQMPAEVALVRVAVEAVADDWVSDLGEMDPDLMARAGLDLHRQ